MKKLLLSLLLLLSPIVYLSAQNCEKVYLNKEGNPESELRSKYIVLLANKSNILLMSFIKVEQKLYLNLLI